MKNNYFIVDKSILPDYYEKVITARAYLAEGICKDVSEAVKSRFVGYLNGGNEEEASSFLKNLNIVNGLDGLDFSGSYVENDTLYVNLKYEMEYDFQPANMENIKVEQTACSKLWKTK